jgi:hypothetical protein
MNLSGWAIGAFIGFATALAHEGSDPLAVWYRSLTQRGRKILLLDA